jgi:hypothetical protein
MGTIGIGAKAGSFYMHKDLSIFVRFRDGFIIDRPESPRPNSFPRSSCVQHSHNTKLTFTSSSHGLSPQAPPALY